MLGTVIVGLLLVIAVAAIVSSLVRKAKGGGGCSCGCGGSCPSCGRDCSSHGGGVR